MDGEDSESADGEDSESADGEDSESADGEDSESAVTVHICDLDSLCVFKRLPSEPLAHQSGRLTVSKSAISRQQGSNQSAARQRLVDGGQTTRQSDTVQTSSAAAMPGIPASGWEASVSCALAWDVSEW